VTVKDQSGKVLFSDRKIYEVHDLHLPNNKDGWLGFDDWDITAMTHINMGLEPFEVDSQTFVVPLKEDTKSVDVEAAYLFIYEEGDSAVINKETTKIEF